MEAKSARLKGKEKKKSSVKMEFPRTSAVAAIRFVSFARGALGFSYPLLQC